MSAPTDPSKTNTSYTPPTAAAVPESPTTVRPFEMDDDDVPETGVLGDDGARSTATIAPPSNTANTAPATDEPAPAKPPRPVTEQQKNEIILKEAFPSIDASVIKAVLAASRGQIDPAFNALLGMSDPDAVQQEPASEPAPPPQPPRPTGRSAMSQLEADELYARQLAEHYDNAGAYEARTTNRGPGGQYRQQTTGLKPNEQYDREHSFIDDDLPVIRENLRKGFVETQSKVNTWFTQLKKKIDGEYDSEEDESQPSKHQHHQHPGGLGRRSGEGSRRSTDYDRYDADPQVLGDDFAGMKLNPDGRPAQGRQTSNPNLYRPPPSSSSPRPDSRKVAFKEGVEGIDPYEASPRITPNDSSATPPPGKQSKWQPLSAVEPSPITDNDPFSLGDSEDEKDSKAGHKDTKMEDSERLKQATADAMADSLVGSSGKSGDDSAGGKK
ncbi:Uu.00g070900.m01.CDS01 [Anthostomella pinea]|uniref:Uu.00g070900.m01.CDS01 n=1 Tax=Anthostomella pinea TaxID=933095 RepID=A0AAI8YNR6_9PEZI|nr:Uu.00g070900.m01.CDS01 [Anthostomella pinea]